MKKMTIVIPMAGAGSRFQRAGYTVPKPFINIFGKPMIQYVIENMQIPDRKLHFIFICQEKHLKEYNFAEQLDHIFYHVPNISYQIISINKLTEGACITVLKARKFIDNDNELLLANSDQVMDWSTHNFINSIENSEADGGVPTFFSTHPKWSYAKVTEDGWITQIKEKEVISPHATVGIYYFKHGKDFVIGADDMIHKGIRYNGEFYVAPVYNQLITPLGLKVINYPIPVQTMHGLGTPPDLLSFIDIMEKRIEKQDKK